MAVDKQAVSGESIVARWSRRKIEAEQTLAASEPAIDQVPAAGSGVAAASESAVAEPLTDADMPDVEALTETSDFSPFMSSGVSDELRNLALRKLFRAPVFNIRDGLDEYDGDYTSFEKLGDIVTCDMKHQIEMQQKKQREALERENEAKDLAAIDTDDAEQVEAIDDSGEGDVEVDMIAADKPSAASAALDVDEVTSKTVSGHE